MKTSSWKTDKKFPWNRDEKVVVATKKCRVNRPYVLNRIDCLNKQNVSAVQQHWTITKVTLDLQLNKIEVKPTGYLNNINQNGLIKGILFFYLFLAKFAFINYKTEKKQVSYSYSFKINLRKKISLNNFMFSLFLENEPRISHLTMLWHEGFIKRQDTLSVNLLLQGRFFYAINYLIDELFTDIRIRSLDIKTSFILSNITNKITLTNLLRNQHLLFF